MKQPYQSRFFQHLSHTASLLLFLNICNALTGCAESREGQIAAIKKEKTEAFFQAEDIVNQPVSHMKRTPDMVVMNFTDWGKHDVITPDFDHVDKVVPANGGQAWGTYDK